MPDFVPIGDTLIKRDRIVGTRVVPEGSLAQGKGSDNRVRLCLQRPDETVEIFPLRIDQTVRVLFDEIRDLLNGVEPEAPESAEETVADESPAAEVEAELIEDTTAAEPATGDDSEPEPTNGRSVGLKLTGDVRADGPRQFDEAVP